MILKRGAIVLSSLLLVRAAFADVSPISFLTAVSEIRDSAEPKQVRLISAAQNGIRSFSNAGSFFDKESKTITLYAAAPLESRANVSRCVFLVEFDATTAVEPCQKYEMVDSAGVKSFTKDLESQAKEIQSQILKRAGEIRAAADRINSLKARLSDVEDINRLALLKDQVLSKRAEIDNFKRDKESLIQFLKMTEAAPAPIAAETRAEELKLALQRLAEALRTKGELPPPARPPEAKPTAKS